MQMPLKLSTLCKEAFLQHPKSAAVYASTLALRAFLVRGTHEGVLMADTQLGAATLQQLQQSGLLQHLANMMTDAAGQLTESPVTGYDGYWPARGMSSTVITVASGPPGNEADNCSRLSNLYSLAALQHAEHLLAVLSRLCQLCPSAMQQQEVVPAAVWDAALQMVIAGLRRISATQQQRVVVQRRDATE